MYLFYINPNRKLEAFDPFSISTYVEIYVEGVKFHSSNLKIVKECGITVIHGLR